MDPTLLAKYYDGLVFIHPDFGRGWLVNRNSRYNEALADATTAFEAQGKPVFIYPYTESWAEDLSRRLRRVQLIPSLDYNNRLRGNHDQEALFMAAKIGKSPDQIKIAAGGLLAQGCVAGWLRYWCKQAVLNYEYRYDYLDFGVPTTHKIAFGQVIHELTDLGDVLINSQLEVR